LYVTDPFEAGMGKVARLAMLAAASGEEAAEAMVIKTEAMAMRESCIVALWV
jgi:hypothetical protein